MPVDAETIASAWRPPVTAGDEAIYRRAGYATSTLDERLGSKPALLVIDMVKHFLGDGPAPLEESQSRYPYSCGPVGWAAMDRIAELIAACRDRQIPVFYTVVRWTPAELGQMSLSNRRTGEWIEDQAALSTFPDAVTPLDRDIIIEKRRPSAFFGTPLAAYLVSAGVDSLVLTGNTTSGCVRATAVDAYSYGYGVTVAADAVFDRVDISHRVSLFDLHHKYACVAMSADVRDRIAGLPKNPVASSGHPPTAETGSDARTFDTL